jgi:hypothetical protein
MGARDIQQGLSAARLDETELANHVYVIRRANERLGVQPAAWWQQQKKNNNKCNTVHGCNVTRYQECGLTILM